MKAYPFLIVGISFFVLFLRDTFFSVTLQWTCQMCFSTGRDNLHHAIFPSILIVNFTIERITIFLYAYYLILMLWINERSCDF